VFAIVQAGQLVLAAGRATDPAQVVTAAEIASNFFATFVWTGVLLCVVVGVLLGLQRGAAEFRSSGRAWLSVAAAVVVLGSGAALIQRFNIDPIRADILVKTASHLADAGRVDIGLTVLDRAVELDPVEPMIHLTRGRIAIKAAETTADRVRRGELFDRAELSLDRARSLAPLDPDHPANLARLHAARANLEPEPERGLELMRRASDEYVAALRLRPSSVVLLNEYGRVLLVMGLDDQAQLHLEHAIGLDPEYPEPYLALGVLWEGRAAAAASDSDARRSMADLERAVAMYDRALLLNPDQESARQGLARVRDRLASVRAGGSP